VVPKSVDWRTLDAANQSQGEGGGTGVPEDRVA
jgi:hypothetical protein